MRSACQLRRSDRVTLCVEALRLSYFFNATESLAHLAILHSRLRIISTTEISHLANKRWQPRRQSAATSRCCRRCDRSPSHLRAHALANSQRATRCGGFGSELLLHLFKTLSLTADTRSPRNPPLMRLLLFWDFFAWTPRGQGATGVREILLHAAPEI